MNNDEPLVEVPELGEGTVVERVDKGSLKPLFDANHEHVYAIDNEEADGYVTYLCTKCPIGYLVAKENL